MPRKPSRKVCKDCGKSKNPTSFSIVRANADGRSGRCKKCYNAIVLKRNRAKPPKFRLDIQRRHRLKKQFGMTEQQYEEMFVAQNGVCFICKLPETGKSGFKRSVRRLAVDHCHKTGRVRALLCHHCNAGLGHFKESPVLFHAAISYIQNV